MRIRMRVCLCLRAHVSETWRHGVRVVHDARRCARHSQRDKALLALVGLLPGGVGAIPRIHAARHLDADTAIAEHDLARTAQVESADLLLAISD